MIIVNLTITCASLTVVFRRYQTSFAVWDMGIVFVSFPYLSGNFITVTLVALFISTQFNVP